MNYPDVYDRARKLMKAKKITFEALSQACKVSITTVRKVLKGVYPGWGHRKTIERILGARLWKGR